jgi:site-specific recombinase XerD
MVIKSPVPLPSPRLRGPVPLGRDYTKKATFEIDESADFRTRKDRNVTNAWYSIKLSRGRDHGGTASKKTVEAYRKVLVKFEKWRLQFDLGLQDIRRHHWDDYSLYLSENGITDGGLRHTLQHLKAFYNFLCDDEDGAPYVNKNPFQKVKKPRFTQQNHEKFVYTPEAFQALLNATEFNKWTGKRDRALFWVARCSGARKSELTTIKLSDLHVSPEESWFTIREGKGGKSRVAMIDSMAYEPLMEYLAVRAKKANDHDYLWIKDNGDPFASWTLGKIANRYSTRINLKDFHRGEGYRVDFWHAFRKTFAQDLAMLPEANRFAIMEQFGWTTGAMMEHYASGLNARELQRSFANVYSNNGGA